MDTLKMFPLEEFEQDASQKQQDETGSGARDVPARDRIDDRAGIGEEHEPGRTEIAAPNPQGSTGPTGDSAGNGELVSAEETSSLYEAKGLKGPFPLNAIALVFPESPDDLDDLAFSIEAIGLLKEITLARFQGPEGPLEVVDGKRRLRACEMAGLRPKYRLLRDSIDPRAYVWAQNAVRRHLKPSQLALAFVELFPKLPPGRPPKLRANCRIFDNLSTPTQGQGAKDQGVSRDLINSAYKVVDPHSRVAPEVREAVRDGTVSVSDAVKDNVSNVSQEVQREALSLVKDGRSRTMAAAVAKVAKEEKEEKEERKRQDEPLIKLDRPTRLGKSLVLHGCSVDRLKRGLKPGTVDLVLAHLPDYVRLELFYKIAELADHVLSDTGVLVVVWAGGPLREMLDGLSRGARGMEFIADFSAIFPAPITELEVPHNTQIRRAALLVFGKKRAVLPQGDDIIEVPAPAGGIADNFMDLKDCLPLVVARFASRGQTLCIPTLTDNCGAVVAALAAGCTVIAADEDQSVIDHIVKELSDLKKDSSSNDPDSE